MFEAGGFIISGSTCCINNRNIIPPVGETLIRKVSVIQTRLLLVDFTAATVNSHILNVFGGLSVFSPGGCNKHVSILQLTRVFPPVKVF